MVVVNSASFLFFHLRIPTKLMEQGTMHIEAPCGLTSSVTLDFQARLLHHVAHIEELPLVIM